MRARRFVAVTLFAIGMLVAARLLRNALGGGDAVARGLFDEVLAHVERNYVDPLDAADLYRKAARGMVAELHDPNSAVLDEARLRALQETTAGEYDGVGVQVDVRGGWLSVIAPVAGGPAEQAGLRSGDRILEVDGRSVSARLAEDARSGLRGPPGTKVTLLVERPGVVAHFPIVITRAAIHVSAVRHAFLLAPRVGYAQLSLFADSSARELRLAVNRLRTEGARAMVLDLRADPGGLLTEGVQVADEFLDPGQAVVTLRGRGDRVTQTFTARAAQPWPDLLLLVLVDGGTASAAEIVAGALQDHDRAVVLGATTYGKGSAQTIIPLENEREALRLTTALWFTPSGRSIQRPHAAPGDTAAPRDSLAERPLASRRAYRTASGRVVYGGGGITPDLIVASQDSIDGTPALLRALGKELPRFRDAVVDEAAAARASAAGAGPVIVTIFPAMRESLWRRARARGVTMGRAPYDSAAAAVDRMLADEIAREARGAEAAYRQRVAQDRVVQAALALADGAATERELLARAAERRAAHREDVSRAP